MKIRYVVALAVVVASIGVNTSIYFLGTRALSGNVATQTSSILSFSGSTAAPTHINIRIDGVEVLGELDLEQETDQYGTRFLLRKEEFVLVIPNFTLSARGLSIIADLGYSHTLILSSDNPNVLVCQNIRSYLDNETTSEYVRLCDASVEVAGSIDDIRTLRTVDVMPHEVSELADSMGLSGKRVKATILKFALEGSMDGEAFLMDGAVLYDGNRLPNLPHPAAVLIWWVSFAAFSVLLLPLMLWAIFFWLPGPASVLGGLPLVLTGILSAIATVFYFWLLTRVASRGSRYLKVKLGSRK